ncbi:MAG: hypothetical protein JWO06_3976, partial [Bacteroidota bacterium]|nr:hypothetical protein [Bacteroidota bacterium]
NKMNELIKAFQTRHLTLALAESVTCGLAAHKLAGVKGTSDVLTGSIICYSPKVKRGLLGVSKRKIEKYSCESMAVTKELVKGLTKLIEADVYAAITGLASDGGSETAEKPVGTIFMAVRIENNIYSQRKIFRGSPLQIKTKAAMELYEFILSKIL